MKKRKNRIEQTSNKLNIGLHVEIIEEEGYFVAYCPALELSSYGKEEQKAKERFINEVTIFFIEAEKKGTLEKYLLKMGWTLRKKPVPQYIPPEPNSNMQPKSYSSFTENVAIPV